MIRMIRIICILLAIILLPSQLLCDSKDNSAENAEEKFAVELTSDTFDEAVARHNHFVMFFAPWCGHCKRLHPLWEQLAEMLNVMDNPRIVIAKVDCTEQQALCGHHEITGFPTLLLFKGQKESIKFKGTRDMPTITEFINQHLNDYDERGIKESEEKQLPLTSNVVELTEDNFAKHVSSGNHFVKFYAPWCGHCQNLAPIWEQLAETLKLENMVSISKLDCTLYRLVCQDFEVKGYPTLLWIEDGKKIEEYYNDRDLHSLKAYVNKMLRSTSEKDDSSSTENESLEVKPEAAAEKLKVLQLNGNNFDKSIQQGIYFVKFYAPWCGHCQKLSRTWDHLAEKFHASSNGVKIAKVDCTASDNKSLCKEQQVQGYPTLYAYKSGIKMAEYDGGRSFESLQSYVSNELLLHDEL